MRLFRKSLIIIGVVAQLLFLLAYWAVGAIIPGPKVSGNSNKHNLSAVYYDSTNNPLRASQPRPSDIKYKAYDNSGDSNKYAQGPPKGRQVCIFCHTPHSANTNSERTPLWNRKFSTETFDRYSSNTLQIRNLDSAGYKPPGAAGWKPDGSSKLCLSCHDGVSGLGNLWRGSIPMVDPNNPGTPSPSVVITGNASFKRSTNKMKFGHHPVSFNYNASVQNAISSARTSSGFKLPTSPFVVLRSGKMQCTTCHDAHQNQSDDDACYDSGNVIASCTSPTTTGRKVVPFWVLHNSGKTAAEDHQTLCENCHNFSTRPSWP